MASQGNESNIDRRERDLYSRNAPTNEQERGEFTKTEYDIPHGWEPEKPPGETVFRSDQGPKVESGFFKKFFIGAVAFFVIAILTFVYMSFGGFNTVSSKNVDISVHGPIAIGGGEELVLDITVTNNNNVALESAELLVEYPSGTREAVDLSTELLRQKESLGPIASGENVSKTVKAVLFGEKDSIKGIRVSVEYKAKGSNATFTKEKNFEIAIKSSPILFSVEYQKEVNSNQPMEMVLSVTSNSNTLLEDVLVRAEYPFGFSFESSTPKPSFDTNVWSIGDLNPKEKRTIRIVGKMEGQNDEEKTFRFDAGTAAPQDEKIIAVNFVATAETIIIRKPFFDLKLALDGDLQKDHVVQIGKLIKGALTWTNNLPVSINDVVIEVVFGGDAFDRNQVVASQQGFYQSIKNMVSWDKRGSSSLAEINPGETGMFNFDFRTLPAIAETLAVLRNPEVTLDIKVTGTRFSETEPPQQISYSFSRNVKVATEATFNPRMVFSVGPFENRGKIPPEAEKETTYTVLWTLTNSFNDLDNVSVSAALPPYVKWENVKSPTGENIMYNPTTNKVIWNPGEIKAGTGFNASPREAAFQISFLPSLGQVGIAPEIIREMIFTGTDRFTGKEIVITKTPLTTRISTDPEFDFGDELVVK